MSCTTKQHWELLLKADVVVGEARDDGELVEGNIGDDEIVLFRGDDTDPGDEIEVAVCGELAGFEGENVNFVVVFIVSGRGPVAVTRVFEREYGDPIVTFETTGV